MISSCIWDYGRHRYDAAVYDPDKENSVNLFFIPEAEEILAEHGIDLRNFFKAYATNRLKSMTDSDCFYEARLEVKEVINEFGLKEISYTWSITQI